MAGMNSTPPLLDNPSLDNTPDHIERSIYLQESYYLSELFRACLIRYETAWELADLERLIHILRGALIFLQSISRKPLWHTTLDGSFLDASECRYQLALALVNRYKHIGTGQTADLDEAVQLLRDCVSNNCAPALLIKFELGVVLQTRYLHTWNVEDLREAQSFLLATYEQCPHDSPERQRILSQLGSTYSVIFMKSGDVRDIDHCIHLQEQALSLVGKSDLDRFHSLDSLACALQSKHRHVDDVSLLHSAVDLHHQALACPPVQHRDRHLTLKNLGACLVVLYDRTGDTRYLTDAVSTLRAAIDGQDPRSPFRVMTTLNLAVSLRTCYTHFGAMDDLQDAIKLLESTLGRSYLSIKAQASLKNQLSMLLGDRYTALGMDNDLEEAIKLVREVALSRPPGHPLRFYALFNLAEQLYIRYGRSRDSSDVAEAVSLLRDVMIELDCRGSDQHTNLTVVCSLVRALRTHYRDSSRQSLLDEAANLCQIWLHKVKDSVEQSIHCTLLYETAETYMCRYLLHRSPEDLDGAILHYRESLDFFPSHHPQKHKCLVGLAKALRQRFIAPTNDADLVEAYDTLQQSLSILPEGHSERATSLFELALLHLERDGQFYSLHLSMKCLLDAVGDVHQNAQRRLTSALAILSVLDHQVSLSDDSEANLKLLEAYSQTTALLPQVAYFGLDSSSRLGALADSDKLASRAAGHALRLADPSLSITLLEQGRAVFWHQYLRLRTPFDDLPTELASKLKNTADLLEHGSQSQAQQSSGSNDETKAAREAEAAKQRRIGKQFEDLVRQARAQSGFDRFMLPDTIEALSASATKGPVVVLLASNAACYAIIIERPGSVCQVHLPDASLQSLQRLADDMGEAVRRGRSSIGERSAKFVMTGKGGKRAEHVLQILWNQVVRPVVHALRLQTNSGRERPRLTLCPTSAFVHLPLHAAGNYRGSKSNWTALRDHCIPSYTPTIGALINARRGLIAIPMKIARTLLASVAQPSKWPALPYATQEVYAIQSTISMKGPVDLFCDVEDHGLHSTPVPTANSIMKKLPEVAIMHLACHGYQDRTSPLSSGFVMSDGMLTVAQLMALKLEHALLAFLSACETAKGDKTQPDQAITLASTMLFAGFRSVIGTMWSMNDVDGPEVAMTVYKELFQEEKDTLDSNIIPYALDKAVGRLQEKGISASRWATYVHIGA